jgi:hypothetical protein
MRFLRKTITIQVLYTIIDGKAIYSKIMYHRNINVLFSVR